MPLTTRLSAGARGSILNALVNKLQGGSLRIYTGPQPATADSAATGTLLATILNVRLFPSYYPDNYGDLTNYASPGGSGVLTLEPLYAPYEVVSVACGVAGWGRYALLTTGVGMDGACGLSGAEFNLGSLFVVKGGVVHITSLTITIPME